MRFVALASRQRTAKRDPNTVFAHLPLEPHERVVCVSTDHAIDAWLAGDSLPPRLALVGRWGDARDSGNEPGPLGIGTSATAAAAVRRAGERFPDGVFWARLGPHPDIGALQHALARALGFQERFASHAQGRSRLRDMYRARRVLLVLDDVHGPEPARALDVIDPRGRLLLISHDPRIARWVDALSLAVPPMSRDAARQLLLDGAGRHAERLDAAETQALDAVLDACERRPLMLRMAAGLAREYTFAEAQRRIEGARTKSPMVRERMASISTLHVLEAAYQALDKKRRQRYRDLGVLPDDEPICVSALAALWHRDGAYVRRMLAYLAARGLVLRGTSDDFWLHEIHRRYVRARDDDPQTRHDRFFDALARPPDQPDGEPDDDQPDGESHIHYLERRAVHHLIRAGRTREVRHILYDLEWQARVLRALGPLALAADIDRFIQATEPAAPAYDLIMMRDSLRMAGDILAGDPEQLAGQLAGRLGWPMGDAGAADASTPSPLLAGVQGASASGPATARFHPVSATLVPPAGSAERTVIVHSARITDVAFSAAGDIALTASLDHTAAVWDLPTFERRATLYGHTDGVLCIALSPDGRHAITGARDATVRVWDVARGQLVRTLSGHRGPVSAIAFGPDGDTFVSGSHDRTLALWRLDDGRKLRTLSEHSRALTCVAMTADRQYALSGSEDGSLKLWHLESGRMVRRMWQRTRRIAAVALLPPGEQDGDALGRAVSVSADGRVDFWSLDDSRPVGTIFCLRGQGRAVAASACGRTVLASAESGWISVLDADTGRERGRLFGHSRGVKSAAISPDGHRALTVSDDQTIKLWSLNGPPPAARMPVHTGPVAFIGAATRGTLVLSVGPEGDLAGWDVATGALTYHRPGRRVRKVLAAMTPDGRHALVSASDRQVTWYRGDDGTRLATLHGGGSELRSACISNTGTYAATGARSGEISLWLWQPSEHPAEHPRESADQILAPISRVHVPSSWALEVACTGDRFVIAHNEIGAWAWTCADARPTLSFERAVIKDAVYAIHGDAGLLLSDGQRIVVFDLEDGRLVHELDGHTGSVTGIQVSGDRAVSIARDSRLAVWDLARGCKLHSLSGDAFGIRTLIGITPDARYVLSQSHGGELTVWELETGVRLHSMRHRAQVGAWAPNADGTRAMTVNNRGALTAWHLEAGTEMASFQVDGMLTTCTLASTTGRVIVGDTFGRVHFLRLDEPGAS